MSLRILLVRHGLSSFNLEHRIQGRDDLSSLTEEGVKQALATGEALRDLPITAAYSSPLRRAHDTATALLAAHGGGLELRLDNDLLEVDLAPWSGLLSSEVQERFPEAYRTWKQHPEQLELQRADGSRYAPIPELMDQARRFVDRLLAEHSPTNPTAQTVLVVGHNAILRCLLLTLLGLNAAGFRRLRLDNASLSVLNLSADEEGGVSVQIESLNGTTHLHPEVCGGRLPAKGAGPRLLLVRHGETDWNRQGRFQGQIDIPLNENGRAQAAAAGDFLRRVSFQRAYTSSMARPRQTAEGILSHHPGVPLTSVRDLVEIRRDYGFPVYARSVSPGTTLGRYKTVASQVPVCVGGVVVHPGDLMVGDVDGVVCVPRAQAEAVLAMAQDIDAREAEQARLILAEKSLRKGLAKYGRI